MKITREALLERNFEESWVYHGMKIYEYELNIGDFRVLVRGKELNIIEIGNEFSSLEIPNCKKLRQLDCLIEMFKEERQYNYQDLTEAISQ